MSDEARGRRGEADSRDPGRGGRVQVTMPHDGESDGGFSHIELCVAPDGHVRFFPRGDARALAKALRVIARLFQANPSTVDCAAGACRGHMHAEGRVQ